MLVLMIVVSSFFPIRSVSSSCTSAEKSSVLLLQRQLLDLIDGEVEVLRLVGVQLDHLAADHRLRRAQLPPRAPPRRPAGGSGLLLSW